MSDTKYEHKTPPLHVGSGTVMNYRQVDDHYIILAHLEGNTCTPFVVASWYPWHGSTEWHQGNYFTNGGDAIERFNERKS